MARNKTIKTYRKQRKSEKSLEFKCKDHEENSVENLKCDETHCELSIEAAPRTSKELSVSRSSGEQYGKVKSTQKDIHQCQQAR